MYNIYNSKANLIDDMKRLIKKEGRYLTRLEICDKLNFNHHLLEYFKISTLMMNKQCKMKPVKNISAFEHFCYETLAKVYKDIEQQKILPNCVSPKMYPLKYDFYIPSLNVLIECDGEQHSDPDHFLMSDYRMECDRIKNQYATDNGITLIRIPYCRDLTKEEVYKYVKSNGTYVRENPKDERQSAAKLVDLTKFKPIPGYEDKYLISKDGEVYSLRYKLIMKYHKYNKSKDGFIIDLRRNGKHDGRFVNDIVCDLFGQLESSTTISKESTSKRMETGKHRKVKI